MGAPTADEKGRNFKGLLSRYTFTDTSGVSRLTEEGKQVIREKFAQVACVSEDAWTRSEGGLQEGFSLPQLPKGVYHRKFDISRLLNFLLFGSDTLGPDLTVAFADLIDWRGTRALYDQKVKDSPKQRQLAENQGMDQDHRAARRSGWSFEETTYISSGYKYIPPTERNKGLNGMVEVYYDPDKIPDPIPGSILGDLYPIPEPSSVTRITLVWPEPVGGTTPVPGTPATAGK